MQQQSLFICLGVTALTSIVSFTVSLSPSLSQSTAYESQPNKVTFFCKQIMDEASGEKFPATVAWVPERKEHVRFIGWKSEYFNKNGWTPAERCEKVTQKFQSSYEQGRLNYLSNGKVNGYLVICGLAESISILQKRVCHCVRVACPKDIRSDSGVKQSQTLAIASLHFVALAMTNHK